mgnify:FL=1
MSHQLNSDHPRLMEFYVENPNFSEPTAMQLFINIETEISYIMSINKSYSLLALNNGNKFVIYGNAKVHNTRYIYGLTRILSGKNSDYFSDRLIRPSLTYYFDNMKFDLENIHLDAGQVLGILYSLNSDNAITKFEQDELAISHTFGDMNEYLKNKEQVLNDRKELGKQLSNFANLDSFYTQLLPKSVTKKTQKKNNDMLKN